MDNQETMTSLRCRAPCRACASDKKVGGKLQELRTTHVEPGIQYIIGKYSSQVEPRSNIQLNFFLRFYPNIPKNNKQTFLKTIMGFFPFRYHFLFLFKDNLNIIFHVSLVLRKLNIH